jgi:hypothetical protein
MDGTGEARESENVGITTSETERRVAVTDITSPATPDTTIAETTEKSILEMTGDTLTEKTGKL